MPDRPPPRRRDAPHLSPLADAPVVAQVVRGGRVESVHHGLVVVTDASGAARLEVGAVTEPIYPRSAIKPVQAMASLRVGADLPDDLLALACASHSGEQQHLDGVRRILDLAGLSLEALRNTPDLPLDEAARRAWLAAGHGPKPATQNCSGKHAAMLLACARSGWDCATYESVTHPLQQSVLALLEELTGEPVAEVSVDGCGAPAPTLSLLALARLYGALAAAPRGSELGRVAGAMRAHPEMVGGADRDVTRLMRGAPGLVAKEGAEAVLAIGLPDGRGVALKIADGGIRARGVVAAAVLRHLDVADHAGAIARMADQPVLGHGRPVGAVEAVPVADLPARGGVS